VVTNPSTPFIYSWETMPERLQAAGVSWKVYSQASSNNNVLPYFKQAQDPATPLAVNGLTPTWPADFQADVAAGQLPQVSWVLAPMDYDEHPPTPPEWGAWVQSQVLGTLVSNPEVWERTALFIAYDENGGFFDHVPPPVAPAGTNDEFLTVSPLPSEADRIAGPIGLGFRVPCLVVSPFSRGGLVCSDTFDHTSLLRFIETRFRVEAPNLSAWRRATVGDLTSALNLAAGADPSVPALPAVSLGDPTTTRECGPTLAQATGNELVGVGNVPPYPLPAAQSMPRQEPGVARRTDGRFSILSRSSSRAGAIVLMARVHTAGRLSATASIRPRRGAGGRLTYGHASSEAPGARDLRLTIHPGPRAVKLLRAGRTVSVTVLLRFHPTCGGPAHPVRIEVTVRPAKPGPQRAGRSSGASAR
jgi:phospholipase C